MNFRNEMTREKELKGLFFTENYAKRKIRKLKKLFIY